MKQFLICIFIAIFSGTILAQVGINNTSPNASLDISATNQANPSNTDGLLIPRVDSFPAINPSTNQQGMMVYLTTTSGSDAPGFYYWDNNAGPAAWVSTVEDEDWTVAGADIKRQNGDVYIGNTNTTDNDLYISNRIVDWDSSLYYLDPDNISRVDEIEFDGGSALDPSIRFSDSGTGFYSPSYQTTAFSTNGSEVFRINNTGNVRIGSTNNIYDYKLIVKTAYNNEISLGSQAPYKSSIKIDHVVDSGNGLDVNVTSTNNSILRSAIKTYNVSGNIRTHLSESSSTRVYGVYNDCFSNSIQDIYGVYNFITNSGSGNHYGTHNRLLGTGNGDKYGSFNFISNAAGGKHYGVYSFVEKTNSYAGYFLGRVSFGLTGTSDSYIFPTTRGTNGQVMQTDGSGNLNWVNTSAVGTDDQNLTSATLTGTSLAIAIENGIGATVDLASLQDGTGTDNQNLTSATLTGSSLAIAIENGTGTSVDLSPLQDADWFEAGGTPPNSINDNIYTSGKVGINTIPNTRLHLKHINNGITGGFKLENTSANYWRLYVSSGATGDFIVR